MKMKLLALFAAVIPVLAMAQAAAPQAPVEVPPPNCHIVFHLPFGYHIGKCDVPETGK